LAAHLPDVSQDQVKRFLRDNQFSSNQLPQLVKIKNDKLKLSNF